MDKTRHNETSRLRFSIPWSYAFSDYCCIHKYIYFHTPSAEVTMTLSFFQIWQLHVVLASLLKSFYYWPTFYLLLHLIDTGNFAMHTLLDFWSTASATKTWTLNYMVKIRAFCETVSTFMYEGSTQCELLK